MTKKEIKLNELLIQVEKEINSNPKAIDGLYGEEGSKRLNVEILNKKFGTKKIDSLVYNHKLVMTASDLDFYVELYNPMSK